VAYLLAIYLFTLFAYSYIYLASLVVSFGCGLGILWFLVKTLRLNAIARTRQLVALVLVIEAIIFFISYNQMNTTLVLFAKTNSDLQFLGFTLSPAQYQLLNPLLIIAIGTQLPRFYRLFPRFTIPYQFAAGTLLAAAALLLMGFAPTVPSHPALVNGNYIGLSYLLLSLAELWVSAIGLSMIGLYCDSKNLAFAMGVWYLAISLSNTLSGRLAAFVAIPENLPPLQSLAIYQEYYLRLGSVSLALGALMLVLAYALKQRLGKHGIELS
jgi:proton-dependent oligopeptide transporter, POT family